MVVHVIWQSSSGDAEDGLWIEIPHFAPKQEGTPENTTNTGNNNRKPNKKAIKNRFTSPIPAVEARAARTGYGCVASERRMGRLYRRRPPRVTLLPVAGLAHLMV